MKIENPKQLDKETRVALRWYADKDGDLFMSAGSVQDAHKLLAPIAEKAVREHIAEAKRAFACAMRDHYAQAAGEAAIDQLPDDDETPPLNLEALR